MKLGFIGIGTIAEAVVGGLQQDGGAHEIFLSPRSEAASRRLADAHGNIHRLDSNAAVVERCDIVFLAVRPDQVETALAGVRFRPDQIVVSFIAAAPLEEIAALVAPAAAVCRVVPLPPIETCRGPVLLYPAMDPITALFQGLGDLIVARDEAELRALSCAGCFMSSYFELQNALAGWLVGCDVEPGKASLYIRSMFASLSGVALATPSDKVAELPPHHETKGGLNEKVRRRLRQDGWFDRVGEAVATLQSLGRSDLGHK
jgi:pyrroline-5-carboxylate reductase